MFGLIKQLAKLITIAKNLPNLIKLLTGIVKDYSPGPEDPPAPTPNILGLSYEIGKTLTTPAKTKVLTVTLPEYIIEYEQESSGWRDTAIDRINSNDVLTDNEKTAKIDREKARHNDRVAQYTQDLRDVYEPYANGLAMARAEQMDPAIRTAVAPITLAIGIPTLLLWLKDVASGCGDVGTPVSADEAEAAFNSDINSAESAEGADGGYPVGSTIVDKEVLLTFSQVEDPAFEYDDNGVAVPKLTFFVKDDVKENPKYNLTLKSYGVNFPSNQKDRITYNIKDDGQINVFWRYASIDTNISQPRFDSSITFSVGADKINRRRFRPDGTTRARNTFVIPIRFASTYPEQ